MAKTRLHSLAVFFDGAAPYEGVYPLLAGFM